MAEGFELEGVKARLLARRDELLHAAASTEDERRPVELDQARVGRLSRMDALQVQAMAIEAERRRAVELQRIDAALGRIADGEFGACTACGEEIAAKRLDFDPAAPTCIDCARTSSGSG